MQARKNMFPGFARTGHLCIFPWDPVEKNFAALQDCAGGGGAEVGLVDSLLCMNQEATTPARDGGFDDAWGGAAPLRPGQEDPFLHAR